LQTIRLIEGQYPDYIRNSQNWDWPWWHTPVIPATFCAGILCQAGTKIGDPIPKITKAKRTGGVVQVAEHLSNKCKALSSNSSTTQNKNLTIKTK
jgi:hypothetical protein